jgi:hypothetical protein
MTLLPRKNSELFQWHAPRLDRLEGMMMKNSLCERLLFHPDCASSQQNPKQLSVSYITNVNKNLQ